MAHNSRARNKSRVSDSPYTPHPTPPPRPGASTRGVRNASLTVPDEPQPSGTQATNVPPHYHLLPTVPSLFTGTLETSLDAILTFNHTHGHASGMREVIDALLRPVSTSTNWPALLRSVYISDTTNNKIDAHNTTTGRESLEELLCLVTRTLLPEQITENRSLMARLYERRKHLAIRLVLRYDMLREWKEGTSGVASLPPPAASVSVSTARDEEEVEGGHTQVQTQNQRRRLMPNIIPTLIAAPQGGWTTHAVRKRMKHHITELDEYLLLSDKEIATWSDRTLLGMASQITLQWQWLRGNNAVLEEMELGGYEELEGKAGECEWIADDCGTRKRIEKEVD
jgi:hypothetical protein